MRILGYRCVRLATSVSPEVREEQIKRLAQVRKTLSNCFFSKCPDVGCEACPLRLRRKISGSRCGLVALSLINLSLAEYKEA